MLNITIPYEAYLDLRVALRVAQLNAEARQRQMEELGLTSLAASYAKDAAEAVRCREVLLDALKQEAA